jgi:hypothetical protein
MTQFLEITLSIFRPFLMKKTGLLGACCWASRLGALFEAQIKTLHQTGLWTQIAGYFLGTALPGFVTAEGGDDGLQMDRLAAHQ